MHGLLISDKKELSDKDKIEENMAFESASALLADVMRLKQEKIFTEEALLKSMELLKLNPELGLAWNYRREAILVKSREMKFDLKKELKLLNTVMLDRQMTKSYCLWNHRRWILKLQVVSVQELQGEQELIETILNLDGRNFHAWSYKQWLSENFSSVRFDDLKLSQTLIERDFSNYSAWFLRRSCWDSINKEKELELVWNGIFTEPTDQSCWQYHDWLLEKFPDLQKHDDQYMRELENVIDEKDSKYVLLNRLEKSKASAIQADRKRIVEILSRIDPMRKTLYLELIEP